MGAISAGISEDGTASSLLRRFSVGDVSSPFIFVRRSGSAVTAVRIFFSLGVVGSRPVPNPSPALASPAQPWDPALLFVVSYYYDGAEMDNGAPVGKVL